MSLKPSRRTFVKTTALTGVGFWVAGGVAPKVSNAANEKVRIACIGIDGKGESDSADAGKHGDVLAICDVDDKKLDKSASKKFPKAKKFNDYRKMLDEMEKQIDACTVSTPDHHHAPAASRVMLAGKHCFCQKPLTHTIWEARRLAEIAAEQKVATQMGNQGTAGNALREAAAVCKSGYLGKIKEVHIWTNRPIWAQGGPRPEKKPVPPELHWDLWLGPAPVRDYGPGYHPFAWRGWWDFGTGALGDMACHTFNMPYMGCDLKNPVSVEATHSGHNKDSYPSWSIIKFEFPKNDWRDAVTVTWYDGGKRPESKHIGGAKSGSLIVGEKATLYGKGDYCGEYEIIGLEKPKNVEYKKSPGHFEEWIRAIRGEEQAMSNFPGYAGGLTETILLGNLAVYAGTAVDAKGEKVSDGKKVEWDAQALKPTNAPELEKIVKKDYTPGWEVT